MGRTKHQFYRTNPYEIGIQIKSRRNQIPILKRKVRHSFRGCNRYADELTFQRFNSNSHYKKHYDEGYQTGNLKGMKYNYGVKDMLERLKYFRSNEKEMGQFIQAVKRQGFKFVRFMERRMENWIGDIRKMLKRRKSLEPFKGHRKPGQLYKRELF